MLSAEKPDVLLIRPADVRALSTGASHSLQCSGGGIHLLEELEEVAVLALVYVDRHKKSSHRV